MNGPRNGRRNPPRNHFSVKRGKPVAATTKPIYHDRLPQQRGGVALRSGDLGLRITVRFPVHVGSGNFVLDTKGKAVKDVARLRGEPVIPGSSIKGCCRQVYELLTGSPQAKEEQHGKGSALSPAAALFGCLGYQGRVSFDDAVPIGKVVLERKKISTAYPPKNSPAGSYKFYGDLPREASQRGRIAAFVIPAGTVLETRLRLRNVSDAEINDLLLSLGVGRFSFRIGGAKYDALGMVSFAVFSLRLHQGLIGPRESSESPADVAAFLDRLAKTSDLSSRASKALCKLENELPPPRGPV